MQSMKRATKTIGFRPSPKADAILRFRKRQGVTYSHTINAAVESYLRKIEWEAVNESIAGGGK